MTSSPAAALLFEHALRRLGEGRNTLDATFLGEGVTAGPRQLAVGEGLLACIGQGHEPGAAESELPTTGAMSLVLVRNRNPVFHVGSDGADPTESELKFLEQMGKTKNSLSLLPSLLSFFMAV